MLDQNQQELIGYVAGTITTISFLPQVYLTLRSHQTAGVSLRMYGLFSTGILLWLIYGLIRKSPSIVIANAVTLFLTLVIIALVIRFRAKKRGRSRPPQVEVL